MKISLLEYAPSSLSFVRLKWHLTYFVLSSLNSTYPKASPPLKPASCSSFSSVLSDQTNSLVQSLPIPPLLHIVWIGDETKIPLINISSWVEKNPHLRVMIWGNHELFHTNWINTDHILRYWELNCYNGVADMMRYEILYHLGGFAVDADSYCLQRIPQAFFSHQAFTCYENSHIKPGLLSTGYFASAPATPLLKSIILSIKNDEHVTQRPAWISVGPIRFTQSVSDLAPPIHIFPHHFFIPQHYSGYISDYPKHEVYAHQYWSTTLRSY